MKVVIFAGGFGTRISEESTLKPKPMIQIGGKPILWHIMKIYRHYGHTEFIICLGYKGYMIKEYFANYFLHNSDVTFDLEKNEMTIHKSQTEDFKVTLVDTGLKTMTAGRLKKVKEYVGEEDFMLTYGDGVADIDLKALLNFHKSHGKIATVSAYQPTGKFGIMDINPDGSVNTFFEKVKNENVWINAGFFVLSPKVFEYLEGDQDDIMWEQDPLKKLTADGQISAYKHNGFWKCMDILNDKKELEKLWLTKPHWKIWQQ